MTCIDATGLSFRQVNEAIAAAKDADVLLEHALGQRYIGAGSAGRRIRIEGVPGNALGAYLDGTRIEVAGNAQDATGDTMNDGTIFIHGSSGDATGYAMRGGRIYVEGSTGYRAGIHMKAYQEKKPVLIVGGTAGSFLGEYQAGGLIVVLGLDRGDKPIVGNFCGTGMHGGKMFLRTDALPPDLPKQVKGGKAGGKGGKGHAGGSGGDRPLSSGVLRGVPQAHGGDPHRDLSGADAGYGKPL